MHILIKNSYRSLQYLARSILWMELLNLLKLKIISPCSLWLARGHYYYYYYYYHYRRRSCIGRRILLRFATSRWRSWRQSSSTGWWDRAASRSRSIGQCVATSRLDVRHRPTPNRTGSASVAPGETSRNCTERHRTVTELRVRFIRINIKIYLVDLTLSST